MNLTNLKKRHAGFSTLELLIATAIMLVVVAGALGALTDSLHANEGVTLMADLEENLRAGMTYMVRDLLQAGEGIPTGGIPIPSNMDNTQTPPVNTVALINRPGPCPAPCASPTKFPSSYATWPGVTPGPALVPGNKSANPNGILINQPSDMITIIYADTTLPLNVNPINSAANPVCKGTIAKDGSSLTFDKNCTTPGTGNVAVQPGDLIMISNAQGNVIQTVTNVTGQILSFAAGDAFGLNGVAAPQGTIQQIQTPPSSGTYPPTSATRIWMITYYIDNVTDPLRPQLMRQVNFRAAQPVGEVLEDLQVSYDLSDGSPTPPASIKQPIYPDGPTQIRKVNLYLAGRSDAPFSQSGTYFRQNLLTQVTLRSMAYIPKYN
jgi:hypothetical protein